jgi:hypothetical protein
MQGHHVPDMMKLAYYGTVLSRVAGVATFASYYATIRNSTATLTTRPEFGNYMAAIIASGQNYDARAVDDYLKGAGAFRPGTNTPRFLYARTTLYK